ncbi:MAG TPA: pirin family protein [Cryomorphaceae bacterium]|nr:pirin family protein [Cryomorphaceae bacterium]
MMESKKINQTLPAFEVDMGGMPVYQPFPTGRIEQIDPFLLFHHSFIKVEEGVNPLHAGVGPHPHRGFMPVTYVIDGELHHRDSFGNSSVVKQGGAQWLSAGRGIVHSERPSAELAKTGGTAEVIQLWINLPQANKLETPSYLGIQAEDMNSVEIAEGLSLDLIAGEYNGSKGKANPPFPVFLAALRAEKKQTGKLNLPVGMDGGFYLIRGKGSVKGHGLIEEKSFYRLSMEGSGLEIELEAGSLVLFLLGKALKEPLATYGPFVMNTQTEIMESIRDYNQGKMGILIEE